MQYIARSRRWNLFFGGAIFVAMLLVMFVASYSASAYAGPSGPANGTAPACGGVWNDGSVHDNWSNSNCGTAWIKYSTSIESVPFGGFSNGTDWNAVRSTCSAVGTVWVFVYFNANEVPAKSYNYTPDVNYSYNQFAAAGKASASLATAENYFNKSPEAQRSGSNWGSDVGWFCYSDEWKIATTSTVDKVFAEPGEVITWTHKVTNNGPGATNADVTWRYQNRGGLGTGAGTNWTFGSGKSKTDSDTKTSTYTVQPADFGKKLCRTTYASPASHQGGSTESPNPSPPGACVTIVKKPKVQVIGGDLQVVGNVQTSSTYINNTSYGSWGEFGVLATGTIQGFSSGAAVKDGRSGLIAGGAFCNVSLLSFNNLNQALKHQSNKVSGNCNAGNIGDYPVTAKSLASLLTSFSTTQGTYSGLGGEHKRVESYTGSTLTISGGTIPKGEWLVINAPTTTVTITGNITYATDELNTIGDIPQLVILAKNIHIAGNVEQVDSWLIASGNIVTCNDVSVTAALTAGICNNQLTVNGPVSASKLFLRRTFGAGPTANAANIADRPTAAAEVFNVRPDATLWAIAHDTTTTPVSIATSKELPPRF